MKDSLLFLALIFAVTASSQIRFEKGHYIDNAGTRHEVLIRNAEWNDNPRKITVKADESSPAEDKTLDEMREFAIEGSHKFVRADVEMDRSEVKQTKRLSTSKNPEFKKERLMLRSLVEGNYKLFAYEESGLFRFFYEVQGKPVSQLVYKKYHPSYAETTHKGNPDEPDISAVRENNQFRNQLWNDVKCPDAKISDVERLKYNASSLENYFVKVNECSGIAQSVTRVAPRRRGKFNVSPEVGMSFMKFSSERDPSYYSLEMSETAVQFGVELEYVLATNANKLAFFVSPNYVRFKGGEQELDNPGTTQASVSFNVSALSVPLGLRYYLFITPQTKIFFNGSVNFNHILGGKWDYNIYDDPAIQDWGQFVTIGLGGGVSIKKFSVEVRFNTHGALNPYIDSNLERSSILARYTIF